MNSPENTKTSTFLLTWYGLTDLRCALGLDATGGPVLAALKTGRFTEALVLAYTDPAKGDPATVEKQSAWAQWLSMVSGEREALGRSRELELVDAFANTPAAHKLFKSWLRSGLEKLDISVKVRLCVKELAMLNDSKGIYEAVVQALDIVQSRPGEKLLTFYLSPGTPVMAFTWAFVALANPELNIQIISSSDPRRPPTQVTLPYDLLAPSNRRLKQLSQGDSIDFDVVFHLFGEQRMAPLLGALQFPAKRHIFVTSDQYPSGIMKKFVPTGAWSELRVNPFDPMSSKIQILKSVAGLPSGTRVGFNLTGGTKLMFAGATAACRKIGGVPFYFETREHTLVFLHDFKFMPIRGVDNINLFFQANGFEVTRQGKWQDYPVRQQRAPLTLRLWNARHLIVDAYKLILDKGFDNAGKSVPFAINRIFKDRLQKRDVPFDVSLDKAGRAQISLDRKDHTFEQCHDFASYLAGGWLEEYVYLMLEPHLKRGFLRDLRVGLEVNWDGLVGKHNSPIQELDIVFTEGRRLYIVECKAGAVCGEHVYKLQQCVRGYGGIDARGIMACAFPPHSPLTRRRLENANNIAGFYGGEVPNRLVDYIMSETQSKPSGYCP